MINKLNLKKTKFFLIIYNILINAIFSYLFLITNATKCRSILRKSENKKPKISVFFLNKPNKVYFFSSNNFEIESLFKTFDKKFFNNNMPPEKITYRYDKTKSVSKKELNTQLQNLIEEIYNKKKQYKYFKILKQANFNRRKKSGLLILKFKDYPFIVKVFMENPKSFVSPYSKGLCPLLFFNMSGGMCRHLLGFTRIKNLHDLQNKILQDPKWSKKTIFPRKWYLLPKDPKYIKIIGTNFDNKNTIYDIIIPGTYFLIADEIKLNDLQTEKHNNKTKRECMSLCNFVNLQIDPNPKNFLLEKDTNKIAIIDTENFTKMVGLTGKNEYKNYFAWYRNMAKKYINDMFFRSKRV